MRVMLKRTSCFSHVDVDEDDILGDGTINEENKDKEQFQIQSVDDGNNFVLVNTRIDYQYRSDVLNNICLYDFVSNFYKKKMNAADAKYLSSTSTTEREQENRKGRPPNQRFPFQRQHPQVTTHLLMEYSELRVPVLYGPQVPRQDRDDTRERYSRALLTLFVPWRSVSDLCDVGQKWEEAFKSRQHRVSALSRNIIDNIQLLHECKKDRDEHLLQIITEAQTDDSTVDPILLPANQHVSGEPNDESDSEDLLELLSSLDECSITILNSMKKSSEDVYIRETIEAVENVGRFSHTPSTYCFC